MSPKVVEIKRLTRRTEARHIAPLVRGLVAREVYQARSSALVADRDELPRLTVTDCTLLDLDQRMRAIEVRLGLGFARAA